MRRACAHFERGAGARRPCDPWLVVSRRGWRGAQLVRHVEVECEQAHPDVQSREARLRRTIQERAVQDL